jgi:hypothetical protein
LLLQRQFRDLVLVESCILLGFVVICFNGLFWLFELNEGEALAFAINLL